jgi:toxin FitB
MWILDTNVVSELMRPVPEPHVMEWVGTRPGGSLFLTAVVEAELRYGLALLPVGRRRNDLTVALEEMLEQDFAERILPFDRSAARIYAEIVSSRRKQGRPISHFDGQIAAIARSRDAGVATRNENDFSDCDIKVINPWQPNAS